MNVGIGISPFFGVKDLGDVQSYIARVLADSGEVANNAKLRELILMLKAQGLYDNTKLLIAPILGGKWRTSGIYKYNSRLYDVAHSSTTGTEKITNAADREFSSDTGFWTLVNSNIGSGALNITGSDGYANREGLLTQNKYYKLTLNCTAFASGNNGLSSRTVSGGYFFVTGTGNYTVYFKHTGSTVGSLRLIGQNGTKYDNLSIQELDWNDADQTAEVSQPYQAGNIAPTELLSIKNPNGDARYLSHPAISFAANEAWSVSVMINWNANNSLYDRFIGNGAAQKSAIGLYNAGSFRGMFISENAVNGVTWNIGTTLPIIGKNAYVNFIAHGDGFISMYINGVLVEKKNSGGDTTAMIFSRLLKGTTVAAEQYAGTSHYYRIQSGAMTAGQITAEYNLLRSWIAEIESVQIGSKIIATSNLSVVASANGTVIADGNLTAAWTPGTSAWCHHTSTAIGSWANKLYNKAAREVIKANPPSGWHVMTEAEATALAALGGNALKVIGTNYWAITGGTNSTGFSAVGSSFRNADGSFGTINETCKIWCADSDKVLVINHNSDTATVEAVNSVNDGYSIRLVKD